MLYSKDGSYPANLPHRIVLSDGRTRTDSSTFTDEEIADAGYVAVEAPPTPEYPNKLDWDGTEWLIREPTGYETSKKWEEIRNECVQRLAATDYKVIKSVEIGELPPNEYIVYRQELRNIYNGVHLMDPWVVELPALPSDDIADIES